jgi:hypothetical protein
MLYDRIPVGDDCATSATMILLAFRHGLRAAEGAGTRSGTGKTIHVRALHWLRQYHIQLIALATGWFLSRPVRPEGGRQTFLRISQNAATLNAKMPMPIHTIVMVMAAGTLASSCARSFSALMTTLPPLIVARSNSLSRRMSNLPPPADQKTDA